MIGNDVVDLADPEAREAALHPRFDARVFAAGERALLRRAADAHAAALGALGRQGGGLQVRARSSTPPLASIPESSSSRETWLRHGARRFLVRVSRGRRRPACRRRACAGRRAGACVPASPAARAEAGSAARRLALDAAARRLGAAAEELEIVRSGRRPLLLRGGSPRRARALPLAPRAIRGLRARARGRGARLSAPRPIRRLAVANRGEAAMRCIRTVKTLRTFEGAAFEVVALYTEVDRDAPFVRHADRALPLRAGAEPGGGVSRPRRRSSRRCAPRAPTRSGPAGASSRRIRASSSAASPRASASSARRPRRCAPSATRSTPSAWPRADGVPVLALERRRGGGRGAGRAGGRAASATRCS